MIQRPDPASVEYQHELNDRQLRHTLVQVAVNALKDGAVEVSAVLDWARTAEVYVTGKETLDAAEPDGAPSDEGASFRVNL